jgi:hypothetical protein
MGDVESYDAAAALCPKVLGKDVKAWEDWTFAFVQRQQLPVSRDDSNSLQTQI